MENPKKTRFEALSWDKLTVLSKQIMDDPTISIQEKEERITNIVKAQSIDTLISEDKSRDAIIKTYQDPRMQNYLPNNPEKEGTRALLFATATFPSLNNVSCYCVDIALNGTRKPKCDILLGGKRDMEYYLSLAHHFTSEGYPSSILLMKFDTNCPKVCMPIAMLHVWNFTKLLLKAEGMEEVRTLIPETLPTTHIFALGIEARTSTQMRINNVLNTTLLIWRGVLEIIVPDLHNCIPLEVHAVTPAATKGEYHHGTTSLASFDKGIASTFQYNPINNSHPNLQAKHVKIYADMVQATAPYLKEKAELLSSLLLRAKDLNLKRIQKLSELGIVQVTKFGTPLTLTHPPFHCRKKRRTHLLLRHRPAWTRTKEHIDWKPPHELNTSRDQHMVHLSYTLFFQKNGRRTNYRRDGGPRDPGKRSGLATHTTQGCHQHKQNKQGTNPHLKPPMGRTHHCYKETGPPIPPGYQDQRH